MSESNQVSYKAFVPIVIIFLLVTCFAIVAKDKLASWQVDQPLVLYGNMLLFVVTFCSWIFHRNALSAGNTQAFLRGVYSAMLLKLFVYIIAFFIYVSYVGSGQVNKPALFAVMFLYFIYTFIELSILMKYSKRNNKNA